MWVYSWVISEPHPLVVGRGAEAGFAQGRRDEQRDMVVRMGRGFTVRIVHGVHEDQVGPALRVPLDARDESCVHVLGDHRRPFRDLLLALVIVDVKMWRFERGPGKGRVEFGECGRSVKKEN